MSLESQFLVKYGLHGFVTVSKSKRRSVFSINGAEGPKMINHATHLISEMYDGRSVVQIV